MREFAIITDSSADFEQGMVETLGIEVVPLKVNLKGKTFANWPDGRELSVEEFYRDLREGEMSSTSQVNTDEFETAFARHLSQGRDVLYIGFSSGLSGTFNAGRIAAEDWETKHPESEAKVIVVDTLAASLGQGLLIWHAAGMRREGKSLEEVAGWLEENKLKMAHWFTVDDLNFLKRGGRVSGAAAMLGSLLKIKPVMHVDNAGKLIPVQKLRGRRQSLDALVEKAMETGIDIAGQMVFISHGDALADAQYVADELKRRAGVQEFYINYVGPVIGSHSGPGTIALFFLASQR